mgnify:FL=1
MEIPGELTDDNYTWEFPVINGINSHGKIIFWQIYVRVIDLEGNNVKITKGMYEHNQIAYHGVIDTNSGVENGKIRKTEPTVIKIGKNIGRAHETNAFTQALLEARGIYNRQLKKKSVTTINSMTLYPPMLANVYSAPLTDSILYIQPKYNGLRAIAVKSTTDDSVIIYSRNKNVYTSVDYLKEELNVLFNKYPTLYFDGEIYSHGVNLQDISGDVRSIETTGAKHSYILYDCFDPSKEDMLYSNRLEILTTLFKGTNFKYLRLTVTEVIQNTIGAAGITKLDSAVKNHTAKFIQLGFEGSIVRRNTEYKYSFNDYHSPNLLKVKPVQDHEMTIVGYEITERGKTSGAIMIHCEYGGNKFPVTPALEITERKALATKMGIIEANGKTHFENEWLGTKIIVYYDELSKDNVPLRARTKLEKRTWD